MNFSRSVLGDAVLYSKLDVVTKKFRQVDIAGEHLGRDHSKDAMAEVEIFREQIRLH